MNWSFSNWLWGISNLIFQKIFLINFDNIPLKPKFNSFNSDFSWYIMKKRENRLWDLLATSHLRQGANSCPPEGNINWLIMKNLFHNPASDIILTALSSVKNPYTTLFSLTFFCNSSCSICCCCSSPCSAACCWKIPDYISVIHFYCSACNGLLLFCF